MNFKLFFITATLVLICCLDASAQKRTVLSKTSTELVSTSVVISEVYGGGGNAGSVYTNDFIELHNRGAGAVDLTGWSVQYASATGTTWSVTNLTGVMLAPGKHYLIQEAVGAGGTTPLPSPDATGTIAMSATAGKIALVNVVTALSGACPTGAQIIDFVGYGTTANCFEGTGPTPAPSNTTSVNRVAGPDTDQNATDFVVGGPNPFNVTAAGAVIAGRVITAAGQGIGNVIISVTDSSGVARTALTNPFGYFSFSDIPTGHTYFVSAQGKGRQFAQPTQVITLGEDLTGMTFEVLP